MIAIAPLVDLSALQGEHAPTPDAMEFGRVVMRHPKIRALFKLSAGSSFGVGLVLMGITP